MKKIEEILNQYRGLIYTPKLKEQIIKHIAAYYKTNIDNIILNANNNVLSVEVKIPKKSLWKRAFSKEKSISATNVQDALQELNNRSSEHQREMTEYLINEPMMTRYDADYILDHTSDSTPLYSSNYRGSETLSTYQPINVADTSRDPSFSFHDSASISSLLNDKSNQVITRGEMEEIRNEIQSLKDEIENLKMLLLEN